MLPGWTELFDKRFNNNKRFPSPLSPRLQLQLGAKNRFVKNETANFGRSIPTERCGPPPEVTPNIPVTRNRNKPFDLNSDRKSLA